MKFKVGDRVVCTNVGSDTFPGTVVLAGENNYGWPYRVRWDGEDQTYGYDEDELEFAP